VIGHVYPPRVSGNKKFEDVTAGGKITGRMYDTTGGLGGSISGTIAGNAVEFTRSWGSNERQYHLVFDSGGNTLTVRISSIPDPTTGTDLTASR
jgi:hypothetical protein